MGGRRICFSARRLNYHDVVSRALRFPDDRTLARDHVQIVFTDILVDLDDIDARNELVAELRLLRMDLEGTLHEEEEIWVTLSPIGIVRR